MTEYELSDEHMEAIFNQYASFRRGPVFEIPVISFFETCETRFYSFLKYRLEWMCERRKIDAVISMDYNGEKYVIFMKGDCHMFSQKDIREMAEPMFFFSEKSDIVKRGYDMSFQKSRKKLFISYSHANKEIVKNIVDEMLRHGLNCWLDEREIDVGENILEAVQNGMRDADLALIFISSATKTALFAQHELKSFWKELIYKKKNWFIVKLDDVDPDEILHGLSDYKYYDYSDTNDIEKLLEALNKKLHKLEIID